MPFGIAFEFLDVGMGDCTLIQMPPWDSGKIVLVDFGENLTRSKEPSEDVTIFLVTRISEICRNRGMTSPVIDHLFITHPHIDHWNKLGDLIDGVAGNRRNLWQSEGGWAPGTLLSIDRLTFGGDWEGHYRNVRTGNRNLADKINARVSSSVTKLSDKDHDVINVPRWNYGGGNIYLLNSNYPSKGDNSSPNQKSLVLMFEYNGYKVILPGDADDTVEKYILNTSYAGNPGFLESFGLKLGHHGSRTSTCQEWANVVKPKAIFASADKASNWGHPYCEAIERVKRVGSLGTTIHHWYTCTTTGYDNDYQNINNRLAICPNLWYAVTTPGGENLNIGNGKKRAHFPQGHFSGVQWRLQLDPGHQPWIAYSPEDTVVPSP